MRRVLCRFVLPLMAVGGVALSLAFAAPSRSAATTTTFTLKGRIAGGITTIQTDQTLTFVFREINHTTAGAPEDLNLTKVTNVSVAAITCVVPGGFAINSDGRSCEPGTVKPGQHASMVVTTTVTGSSGAASARVCLSNGNTGVIGPCKTLSANIA
jgi:hypothetical protein